MNSLKEKIFKRKETNMDIIIEGWMHRRTKGCTNIKFKLQEYKGLKDMIKGRQTDKKNRNKFWI